MNVQLNDHGLRRKLDDFERRLGDLKPVFANVGDDFVDAFKENFPREGGVLGEKWDKLAPSTIEQKIRLGFASKPILVRTGKLRDSFEILDLGRRMVKIGTTIPYSIYHQTGTSKMPERPIVGVPERMKGKIGERILDHAMKAFEI